MPLNQLGRAQWHDYFERISAAVGITPVSVEAAGLGMSRKGEDYLPLARISYDEETDALTLLAGGEAQSIAHPRQVYVDRDEPWVHAIEIVDGEGVCHHVLLKDALELRSE